MDELVDSEIKLATEKLEKVSKVYVENSVLHKDLADLTELKKCLSKPKTRANVKKINCLISSLCLELPCESSPRRDLCEKFSIYMRYFILFLLIFSFIGLLTCDYVFTKQPDGDFKIKGFSGGILTYGTIY